MSWPNNPVLDEERWDVPLNNNLTAIKNAVDALDTRLDGDESTIASHTSSIATNTSSITSQGTRLTTAEANIVVNTRRPNTFAALGDSLVMNGVVSTDPGNISAANWLMWSVMKSGGLMQYVGSYGLGGKTSGQILSTYLPQVLALSPKPGYCVVQAGTNDVAFSDSMTNLAAIYTALLSAGITPVVCSNGPRSTAATPYVAQLNAWLARYAYTHQLPYLDAYTMLADTTTGSWASVGDTTDNTHYTGVGAKKIGDLLYTTMESYIKAATPWSPPLVQSAADTTNLVPNALFLTDANADGIADNWSAPIATTVTFSREDPSDGVTKGKWQRCTCGASGSSAGYVRLLTPIAVTPGDLIAVGCRMQVSAASEATFGAYTSGWYDGSTNSKPVSQGTGITSFVGIDMPPATFYKEFVVPSGVASIRPAINCGGPNGYVQIAQVTMRNLTALGIS